MKPVRKPAGKPSERGAALLAAMFIVALMAAVAAAGTEEIRYALRRSQNVEARDQAYWYALGAETLARGRIADPANDAERRLLERAAAEGQTIAYPIEGGSIAATLTDLQNCFNLNSLVERTGEGESALREPAFEEYRRLLGHIGARPGQSRQLAAALADWLDSDTRPRSGGAEDAFYLSTAVPYRAPNGPVAEIEELRAVMGYEEEIFMAVRPLVCALPGDQPAILNINTIRVDQAPLLAALLGPELSLEEARDVIAGRPAAGFADANAFFARPRVAEAAADEAARARIGLASERFALTADVRYRGAELRMDSVIAAPPAGAARVLSRRFGSPE